jgi:hypothetical protein
MSLPRLGTCVLCLTATLAACDRPDAATAPPALTAHALTAGSPIVVTSLGDAGPGSLRDAIAAAITAGGGTIAFDPALGGRTITLAQSLQIPSGPVTIDGGPGGITLSGGNAKRPITVTGGTVVLRNLTIADGSSDGLSGGGLSALGTIDLTLDHVTVSGNKTASGGTVGGGLFVGGLANLTITNSTLSGNTALGLGGAIHFSGGNLTIVNSTITGNTSGSGGAGFAIASPSAKVQVINSIMAGNSGTDPNCWTNGAPVLTSGKNIIDVAGQCGSGAAIIEVDPGLLPLAANGGPTMTHAVPLTSPAIDAAVGCTVTDDQRHVARPQNKACDIGSFEFSDYTRVGLVLDPSAAVNPNTGVAILTGRLTCSAPVTVTLGSKLTQTQKSSHGTSTTAEASGSSTVACSGNQLISVSLAPPTGAFQSGTGTASLSTSTADPAVIAATANGTVKMYWGHK